jgi:hypothetical protein
MQNALTEARGEQLEIERIHRMLNYAWGERCLTANLLDYFGETIADCGHCSGVGSAELDDFLHGLASTEMNRSSPAASRMREGRRVSDKKKWRDTLRVSVSLWSAMLRRSRGASPSMNLKKHCHKWSPYEKRIIRSTSSRNRRG